jgi:alanyl-tRNA synthetase
MTPGFLKNLSGVWRKLSMTKLSNAFHEYFNRCGAISLEESSVVRRPEQDTYFTMSPVAAHMEKFRDYQNYLGKRFCVTQATFSSNRLEDTHVFPLAQPYETMFSYFSFGAEPIEATLSNLIGFMEAETRLKRANLVFRLTEQFDISRQLNEMNISEEQIFVWKKDFPLVLGAGVDRGHYSFIYSRYKHGLVPIAVVGFIETPSGILVDSVIFEDRIQMIDELKEYPYLTSKFIRVVQIIQESVSSEAVTSAIVNYTHASLFLYLAGCRLSNTGSGHVLKRLVRETAWIFSLRELDISEAIRIYRAMIEDAKRMGCPIKREVAEESVSYLYSSLETAYLDIGKKTRLYLFKKSITDVCEAKRLRDTHGIREEWIKQYNELHGNESFEIKQTRFSLRNHLYPFMDENTGSFDPVSIMKEAESIRGSLSKHNK